MPTYCTAHAFLKDPEFSERALPHILERYRELEVLRRRQLRRAREAGVRIAMGTDVGTPGNHCGENMQEVVLMVEECGFSPAEAIHSATVTGAELLGLDDTLGRLKEGMAADIIATPRNPLEDIYALMEVDFVMKAGEIFRDDPVGRL